jgi:DNA repair protein RadA/Sms
VAAALVSALADKPLATHAIWFGEVSLAGEIRPVSHAGLRLREAAKLGFGTGYGPADAEPGSSGLNYRGLRRLANLVDRVMADA